MPDGNHAETKGIENGSSRDAPKAFTFKRTTTGQGLNRNIVSGGWVWLQLPTL